MIIYIDNNQNIFNASTNSNIIDNLRVQKHLPKKSLSLSTSSIKIQYRVLKIKELIPLQCYFSYKRIF